MLQNFMKMLKKYLMTTENSERVIYELNPIKACRVLVCGWKFGHTLVCGWRFGHREYISIAFIREETFLQDFLVILKRMFQNYKKIKKKCFLFTDSSCGSGTIVRVEFPRLQ